jgi:hypothetical protein
MIHQEGLLDREAFWISRDTTVYMRNYLFYLAITTAGCCLLIDCLLSWSGCNKSRCFDEIRDLSQGQKTLMYQLQGFKEYNAK